MNKKDSVEALLFAGFRLLSVGFILTGIISLVFQLLESWDAFDPSYLGAFLASTVLRPLILIIAGIILYCAASGWSRSMAARYGSS